MDLAAWLSIALVCTSGAMSPGPSLAVVVKNTVRGGRAQGVLCGIGHGLGVGIYAFAAVAGLYALVGRYAEWITLLGAIYLSWMGARILWSLRRSASEPTDETAAPPQPPADTRGSGFTEGFLIAFLNPKIAVFFLALLGSFVPATAGLAERSGVAALAMVIDGTWYVLVAAVLAASGAATRLASRARLMDALLGLILLALGISLLIRALL